MTRQRFYDGIWSRKAGARAIFIYTDSSPTRGQEVLGTLLDVLINGEVVAHAFVLTGALLAHGYQGVLSKSATVLWQLWLSCGPDLHVFLEVLLDVRCFITDCGTESLLADGRSILEAWAQELKRAARTKNSPPPPPF